MTDEQLLIHAKALLAAAVPFPWNGLLTMKGPPRSMRSEQATLELAHLAPELVRALERSGDDRDAAVEAEVAELQAELEALEMETADEHLAAEVERLSAENDRLRAEVARLNAALNGTLVDGVPR